MKALTTSANLLAQAYVALDPICTHRTQMTGQFYMWATHFGPQSIFKEEYSITQPQRKIESIPIDGISIHTPITAHYTKVYIKNTDLCLA